MRKRNALLVLWCAFVMAPGPLVELGLFGQIDTNTNITGGVILVAN